MGLCRSILVAEDNDDTREMIVRHYRRSGYHVEGARNGDEALWRLGRLPGPVLVLLDLMMPVMDGWQFLNERKGRKLEQHQIVTISAVGAQQEKDKAFVSEVAGNLPKPLFVADLDDVARRFCGLPSPAVETNP